MAVNSADKKPEKYVGPDGKPRIRMVPVDREVVKSEAKDGDGVNIVKDRPFKGKPMKKEPSTGVGIKFSDMRKSKWAKDADANPHRAKPMGEAYEPEPPSPDEKSMAMRQAKFIQYVGEELMEYMEQEKDFPEWMQNKLSELHQSAKDMHGVLAGEYEDEEEMDEEKGEWKTDSGWKKPETVKKDRFGNVIKNVSRHLAKAAAKKSAEITKEEVELDELSPGLMKRAFDGAAKRQAKAWSQFDLGKRSADSALAVQKKSQRLRKTAADKINQKAFRPNKEDSVAEVLDRPGALDSYRKKAKTQSDKARNSATAKLVRGNPDISKEKDVIRKREKGLDKADQTANKQFRKSLGLGYSGKKEGYSPDLDPDVQKKKMISKDDKAKLSAIHQMLQKEKKPQSENNKIAEYGGPTISRDAYLKQKPMKERELTPGEMKKREKYAQDLPDAEFKKRYGDRWKSVKIATATKMAKGEK